MTVDVREDAIRRALRLIGEHPAVDETGSPTTDQASGVTRVEVTFTVNLPSEWRSTGKSPSGVEPKETVRFDFPSGFPMEPPEPSLREEFGRNLPHMQPWMIDGRPVPCIYDGDLAELFHRGGLAAILNQIAVWLDRAALGTLIDPDQGWEPVRRDSFEDVVVAEGEALQGLVDGRGGYRFAATEYLKVLADGKAPFVHGRLSDGIETVMRKGFVQAFSEGRVNADGLCTGKSLALVVWGAKTASGAPMVCDTYLPETVEDVSGLRDRAQLYGCKDELNEGLRLLAGSFSGKNGGPYPLVVVLLARRPCNVIGSDGPIELCPYVVDVSAPVMFAIGGATPVRAVAHRDAVSRALLARMAGGAATAVRPEWTLLGAGSLGSKVALHLARAGNGPTVVVDKSSMAPHNAARHALVPATGDMQVLWTDGKARKLSQAIAGLGQEANALQADGARVLTAGDRSKRGWSPRSWAVVNATASLALREALAAASSMPVRVVETSLFGGGKVGAITVEGPERNPTTTDLMAEVYVALQDDPALASMVFDGDAGTSRQVTGQGCGSMTMTMSDGRLSLFAAGVAEYLLAKQRTGLPVDGGEVLIGRLSDEGLGVDWGSFLIPRVTRLRAENGLGWRVHVHPRAVEKMREEGAQWPTVETGGVLMGRLSEVSRVAHVVDVLEAPPDSERSSQRFTLGTKGLRRRVKDYSESVDWSLYCLGTWHSHLSEGGPSDLDKATATAVALARLTPTIFLIMTPTGFHALAAGM